MNGRVTTSDILEPDVDDILGRDQVIPDIKLMSRNIKSKKILITGAGGSIGSELSRQIIKLNPKKVLLLDISEYSLYKISSELEDLKNSKYLDDTIEIISILGSVQDKKRISDIVNEFMPDVIYHTAAYKHVPLVEENILEGIKNNVFGTLVCLQVAVEKNVSNMVLVSTDKAVRPTNVMGATKRIAELCIQGFYNSLDKKKTKFSIVRFGNVLDSSGSVIPKFKSQISRGGPVTLTHPEVTRYFMTIPEAAELVIQAGNLTEGCDIFVLDMGKPVKIKNLIEKMVNLSGLNIQDNENPDGDIKIEIIGLRQGEKLYEELLIGDNPQNTKHKKIKKAQDPFLPWNELSIELEKIEQLMNENDLKEILKILQKLVSGYKPNTDFIKKILTKEDNNRLSKSFEKETNNKIIHLKKNF
jgi:FlaA1/EpsC-like NDP-sugar epimerase